MWAFTTDGWLLDLNGGLTGYPYTIPLVGFHHFVHLRHFRSRSPSDSIDIYTRRNVNITCTLSRSAENRAFEILEYFHHQINLSTLVCCIRRDADNFCNLSSNRAKRNFLALVVLSCHPQSTSTSTIPFFQRGGVVADLRFICRCRSSSAAHHRS